MNTALVGYLQSHLPIHHLLLILLLLFLHWHLNRKPPPLHSPCHNSPIPIPQHLLHGPLLRQHMKSTTQIIHIDWGTKLNLCFIFRHRDFGEMGLVLAEVGEQVFADGAEFCGRRDGEEGRRFGVFEEERKGDLEGWLVGDSMGWDGWMVWGD
ncbi:hypothetical protein EX30DRAFT_344410 [Ascodesmis nigricans]|uniref:Uncharacterized protein n=1 Tax=Ascodesmis nigricans TaxID=341454 RepID=A0A4V3SHQ1_9PEZI|nr:hypothetical protein EX30DRAFT_344410 [Ascodesmis nigricans]